MNGPIGPDDPEFQVEVRAFPGAAFVVVDDSGAVILVHDREELLERPASLTVSEAEEPIQVLVPLERGLESTLGNAAPLKIRFRTLG